VGRHKSDDITHGWLQGLGKDPTSLRCLVVAAAGEIVSAVLRLRYGIKLDKAVRFPDATSDKSLFGVLSVIRDD
jgi:hypothetical protein